MAYEQTREFLAHLPWPAAGEKGYINLHWRDKGSNYWSGRACKNVDEFIQHLSYWGKGERDFYVCMSQQTEMEERVSKKGYPYFSAVRSTQNAALFNGVWLDLDFKNYTDGNEAAQAFGEFIKTTGLPAPTLYVSSGFGLHVHWILQAVASMGDWQGLAHALAEACKRCALRADTAVTVDAARILRLPDTFNYKYDPPRRVKLIHVGKTYTFAELEAPLLPYKVATPKASTPNILAAGIKAKPINVSALISECGFIANAVTTNGANHQHEPEWHMTTLLSTFMEDGRELAHIMAKGNQYYKAEDTDKLFDRKEKEKLTKNIGWPSCQAVSHAGSKACATCVHFGAGKSPLNFAVPPIYVTSKVAKLPDGYRYDTNGKFHVEKAKVDADGVYTWDEVASWPMYDAWVELSEDSKLHFTSSLQNKPVLVELAIGDIDVREMRRVLQRKGFEIFATQVKALGTFLMAWLKELKAQNQFKGNIRSLGWDEDNTNFAYGGSIWGVNGATSTPACPDVNYIPKGELDPWKRASMLVTDQQRPELNAIIAASFGAPLTTFTGHACWMFSVYSAESGAGKTTAMKTAQAVWGNPSKAMQSLGDTPNAVHYKLGRTANMPLFWDEMKIGNAASIKNVGFFLALSGGREKDRLNSNAEAKEVHTWRTILIGANNASMIGFVTNQSKVTDAELMRIIELDVPPRTQGTVSPTDASQTIGDLDTNYGKAGEVYAEFIGANVAKIKLDIVTRSKELEVDINITSSERFWQANYACLTLGAEYANNLGLTQINVQALKDCLRNNIVSMRVNVKEEIKNFEVNSGDIAGLLWEFMSSQGAKHKMVTDHIWQQGGRPTPGYVNMLGIPNQILNSDLPFTQVGVLDKLIRVDFARLSHWLTGCSNPAYRENPPMVLSKIAKHVGVTVVKNASIGAGAGAGSHCSPNVKVLDFDVTQIPELQQLLDHSATTQSAMGQNVVLFPAKP